MRTLGRFSHQNNQELMKRKKILNRADVSRLVHTFYAKVRADEDIGPFFNESISDWSTHLERLTDFWETNLFFVQKYKGNPMLKHQAVNRRFDAEISSYHFGIWLNLWFNTIDTLFEGEKAERAKDRARKMGTHLILGMALKK